MSDRKIVSVIDTGYESFEVEKSLLSEIGYELEIFAGARNEIEAKIEFAKNAEGLFIRWTEIDDKFLNELPNLKAICRYGVGYDNINLDSAQRFGIQVSNVSGYATHSVSDHAMMLLYAVLRDIKGSERQIRNGYTQPGRKDVFELHQKTLGIIGLGRIGSMFCKKAKALFNQVVAYDPYADENQFKVSEARKVGLEELLKSSDVISIHCVLSDETHHMVDTSAFVCMDRTPILINTSRGGVVEEAALKMALESNKLYGVGIDVFSDEPPLKDMDEVINHPKVIATGHNAWYSAEAQRELQLRATKNMVAMLLDQPCEDLL